MYILQKIILTTTFILLSNFIVNAQNLKIADLLNMYKKATWEDVNNFVSTKGWDFYDAKEESEIQWSYKKTNYNDRAQGWLHLKVDGNLFKSIRYQITNQTTYTKLVSETKQLGFKKIKSEINDGMIISKFSNDKYILSTWIEKIKIKDYSDGPSYNSYQIKITKIRVPVFGYEDAKAEEAVVDSTAVVYEKETTKKLFIGQRYQGGIIAYIDEIQQHGLIATEYDIGEYNSMEANSVCENLTRNGYYDWYLPSIWELELLCHSGLLSNNNEYWSSSFENDLFNSSITSTCSITYYCFNTNPSLRSKSLTVRAVRKF